MPLSADTVYNHNRPWQGNEERLTGEALAAQAGMTAEEISRIRPPIPRISAFPPRFGYEQHALTIEDVFSTNQLYPGARTDYSGNTSGMAGTSFPSLGVM